MIKTKGFLKKIGNSYFLLVPLTYIKDEALDIKRIVYATLTNDKELPKSLSNKDMLKEIKKGVNKQ